MRPLTTDRRGFLAGSSAWLLAGAAARAAADETGDDEAKVRVAVVGTGARGSDLIRALTTIDRAELVAVCDDYPPHLGRGREYAGPQARPYADYAQMLREVKPEAVVVATPLDRHLEMCLEALDAGCAVFCEKTMCQTIDQARTLTAAVESRGAVFQVGLQRRANAIYRQAAAMVAAGMLGRITAIKCQWHRNNSWRRPVPVPRDDPRWPELEKRLNWRLYRDHSRGLMAELASHQLDVANWFLGTPPSRAIGSGGIDYWRDGREVLDNVFCIYDYQLPDPGDGPAGPAAPGDTYTVRVTYSSLQNNAYEGASELVMGTKGTLFLSEGKGLFFREGAAVEPLQTAAGAPGADAAALTAGKTLKLSNDPWAHRGKPFEIDAQGDDTRDELIRFLQCVAQGDRQTLCDARAGLINAATILIGDEALHTGRPVEFPAELRPTPTPSHPGPEPPQSTARS